MPRSRKYLWNQVPLFRVLWPFIGGIIIGIFLPDLYWAFGCTALMLVVIAAYPMLRQHPLMRSLILLPLFVAAGYVLTAFHTDRLFESHYSSRPVFGPMQYIGTIASDPIPREKSVKCEMELEYLVSEHDTQRVSGNILVYFAKDSDAQTLGYGDRMVVQGRLNEIQPPKNPNEFNYKRYMHFHQIGHQLYLPREKWKLMQVGDGLIRSIHGLQHGVMDILMAHEINDRELAILSALLVGYKHHLSTDQVYAFASAGAMHVLAVSGLHVGIVFLIVSFLCKPLERMRHGKYLKGLILFVVLWGYAALTGLSPSVTRASTMFSFVILAQQFNRHTDIFNTLATSALFLLVLNPFLIVEVGFQLSYLAVLGIVVLQPHIYNLWQPKWWLVDKIWSITAVSVAAQVATFPLGLLYFHQFPNYFLLSNLVVIPAATIILPIGIALVTFAWVPLLSDLLGMVLYYLVHLLDLFIQWVEQLPGALIEGIDISIFETYFIYMIILTSVVFLIRRSYPWLVAFLVTLCMVEGLNIAESIQQQGQKAIAFYRVKGHDAVDFVHGHHHVFMTDTALQNNFDKMRFHIHHHWWARDLEAPTGNLPGLTNNEYMTSYAGKTIIQLGDSSEVVESMPQPDILLITARTAQHPKEVLQRLRPELVVLSSKMDWKTRRYWIKLMESNQQRFHDLYEDGALVMEL